MTLDGIKKAAKSYGCRKYVATHTTHFFSFTSKSDMDLFAQWVTVRGLHFVRSTTHLWVAVRYK